MKISWKLLNTWRRKNRLWRHQPNMSLVSTWHTAQCECQVPELKGMPSKYLCAKSALVFDGVASICILFCYKSQFVETVAHNNYLIFLAWFCDIENCQDKPWTAPLAEQKKAGCIIGQEPELPGSTVNYIYMLRCDAISPGLISDFYITLQKNNRKERHKETIKSIEGYKET